MVFKSSIYTPTDLSGYVPYTGATADLDMGVYTITTPDLYTNIVHVFDAGANAYGQINLGNTGYSFIDGSGNPPAITMGSTLNMYDPANAGYNNIFSYNNQFNFNNTNGQPADVNINAARCYDSAVGGFGSISISNQYYSFVDSFNNLAAFQAGNAFVNAVHMRDNSFSMYAQLRVDSGYYYFEDGGGAKSPISLGNELHMFDGVTDCYMRADNSTFKFFYNGAIQAYVNCSGLVNTSNGVIFDVNYSSIYDQTLTPSIDANNRYLRDSGGNLSADYGYRQLYNSASAIVLDYDSLLAYNSSGGQMISWSTTRNSNSAISFDASKNLCLQGKTSYYNNIVTAGQGTTVVRGTSSSINVSAAIAATTVEAVAASNGGMRRISFVAKITRAAAGTGASSILGGANGFKVSYTDATDSVTITTGTIINVSVITLTLNTTSVVYSGSVVVNAKASTNIQFTFDYTSVGATAMQYALNVTSEQLT